MCICNISIATLWINPFVSLFLILTEACNSSVLTSSVFSFSSLSTTFSMLSFIIPVTSLTIFLMSCNLSMDPCLGSAGGSWPCVLSIRMFIFSCSFSEKANACLFLLERCLEKKKVCYHEYVKKKNDTWSQAFYAFFIFSDFLTMASLRLSDCKIKRMLVKFIHRTSVGIVNNYISYAKRSNKDIPFCSDVVWNREVRRQIE